MPSIQNFYELCKTNFNKLLQMILKLKDFCNVYFYIGIKIMVLRDEFYNKILQFLKVSPFTVQSVHIIYVKYKKKYCATSEYVMLLQLNFRSCSYMLSLKVINHDT